MTWGLCTLVSAHWACLLCHRACVNLPWLSRPALCITDLACTCLGSPGPPSMPVACMHLSWFSGPILCAMRFVCTAEVCMPHLSGPSWAWPLHHENWVHLRDLYAVPLLATWAHPLWCEDYVYCRGLHAAPLTAPGPTLCTSGFCGLLSIPWPAVWSGPQSMSFYGLGSATFCFLPSKSLLCPASEILQLPLGPLCEGASQSTGTLPASWLPPCLRS